MFFFFIYILTVERGLHEFMPVRTFLYNVFINFFYYIETQSSNTIIINVKRFPYTNV